MCNQEKCKHMHSQKFLHVHSNIIHNIQKEETTQRSITNEHIKILCYIHEMAYYVAIKRNKLLTQLQHGCTSNTLCKWKKPVITDCIVNDTIYRKCSKGKSTEREISSFQRLGGRGGDNERSWLLETMAFEGDKIFWNEIICTNMQIY